MKEFEKKECDEICETKNKECKDEDGKEKECECKQKCTKGKCKDEDKGKDD